MQTVCSFYSKIFVRFAENVTFFSYFYLSESALKFETFAQWQHNVLLRLFCGNHYPRLRRRQPHTHLSTVLTYNPQKKCAGTHHYIMGHNSPSAIQSHGRQGQTATRSHPSPALIITLGPLRRESGSPGPEIVARKRLCRAKTLCNPILIQACILLSGVRKVQQWLVKKRGMCVCANACQRGLSTSTYTRILEESVPKLVCGQMQRRAGDS